jgi:hypothetical protein
MSEEEEKGLQILQEIEQSESAVPNG